MADIIEDSKGMAERLLEIPRLMQTSEKKIGALGIKIKGIAFSMTEIEKKTYAEVSTEKGDDGKPLYTNDGMRQAEVNKRLGQNTEYKIFQEEESDTARKMYEEKADLEFIKKEFEAYRLIIELTKVTFRMA